MLDRFFSSPRILERLRRGALGPRIEALAADWYAEGYARETVRTYTRVLGHFSYWLEESGIAVDSVDAGTVRSFTSEHMARCACPVPRGRRTADEAVRAALWSLHLVSEDVAPQDRLPAVGVLRTYDTYLFEVRGLAPRTRADYLDRTGRFLEARFGAAAQDLAALRAPDVVAYLTRRAAAVKAGTLKQDGIALRSFLRWVETQGQCPSGLARSVPAIQSWRLSALPKTLTDDAVAALERAADRTTAEGRRDHAMVMAFLSFGLRAVEVARLSLDDFDWRSGTVCLAAGKGRRERLLPVPVALGRAVVHYLRHGRPSTRVRQIFVQHRIRRGLPLGYGGVAKAVRRLLRIVDARPLGTHALRHTAATRLLRRGASLKEIADLLGHRSLDTTAVYAKVELEKLRDVASPWPEVRP